MNSLRNRILALTVLGLAYLGSSAIPAAAQGAVCKGSFTLPVATEWQNAKLPAGHYTFSMNSVGFPIHIRVEGENGAVYVGSVGTSQDNSGDKSFLILEQRGDSKYVRELYLAQLGLHVPLLRPVATKGRAARQAPGKDRTRLRASRFQVISATSGAALRNTHPLPFRSARRFPDLQDKSQGRPSKAGPLFFLGERKRLRNGPGGGGRTHTVLSTTGF